MQLNIEVLCSEARAFSNIESEHYETSLYGVTDGKAIGTYFEQKFKRYLEDRYQINTGNSASGLDLPELDVDIKVTSARQPQSSSPFRNANQKVYGLGYHLLVFVYEKIENHQNRTSRLNILHTIFIHQNRTADFQTTNGILNILQNHGNLDDILGFLYEKNLPLDEIGINQLAECILNNPPNLGYLTISNALQWRLQYQRVIEQAGFVEGLFRLN